MLSGLPNLQIRYSCGDVKNAQDAMPFFEVLATIFIALPSCDHTQNAALTVPFY